jgi:hypothetical protein
MINNFQMAVAASEAMGSAAGAFGDQSPRRTATRWRRRSCVTTCRPSCEYLGLEPEPDFEDATLFTDAFGRPDVPTDPDRLTVGRTLHHAKG